MATPIASTVPISIALIGSGSRPAPFHMISIQPALDSGGILAYCLCKLANIVARFTVLTQQPHAKRNYVNSGATDRTTRRTIGLPCSIDLI